MFNLFKCKHPFNYLLVDKSEKIEQVDADFISVSYYFVCAKCDSKLVKQSLRFVDGVDGFLNRKG